MSQETVQMRLKAMEARRQAMVLRSRVEALEMAADTADAVAEYLEHVEWYDALRKPEAGS